MAELTTQEKKWLAEAKEGWTGGQSYCASFCCKSERGWRWRNRDVCYAGLIGVEHKGLIKARVYVPYDELRKEWVEFLINSKWVGQVFKTKTMEEGAEYGYEIDVDQPYNVIRGALIMLRGPYEHPNMAKTFATLREWGASVVDAFYFSHILDIGRTRVCEGYSGHGKQVKRQYHMDDIVEGNLYNLSKPASVTTSNIGFLDEVRKQRGTDFNLGKCDAAFARDHRKKWAPNFRESGFEGVVEGGDSFGGTVHYIPNNKEAVMGFINHCKEINANG